jgi:aarF domain-containing kinase
MGQPEIFATATLMRPWKAKSKESPEEKEKNKKTDLERSRELKERFKTFLVNVELVPMELVFIGRCLRIVQANNQAMGLWINSFWSWTSH